MSEFIYPKHSPHYTLWLLVFGAMLGVLYLLWGYVSMDLGTKPFSYFILVLISFSGFWSATLVGLYKGFLCLLQIWICRTDLPRWEEEYDSSVDRLPVLTEQIEDFYISDIHIPLIAGLAGIISLPALYGVLDAVRTTILWNLHEQTRSLWLTPSGALCLVIFIGAIATSVLWIWTARRNYTCYMCANYLLANRKLAIAFDKTHLAEHHNAEVLKPKS